MPIPISPSIELSAHQRLILEKISRQKTSSVRDVERSKLLLSLSTGLSNAHIRTLTGYGRPKVRHWRFKWLAYEQELAAIESKVDNIHLLHDLEALIRHYLSDAPRPGAPCKFTSSQYCAILGICLENPDSSKRTISEWTPREVADEAAKRGIVERISTSQVGRFFKRGQFEAS